ncbi:MAG TPA: hypothetical protein VMD08_00405 [Candidatus Baltobacteraceae bacterium]|nr:hypothetical protein [Candidatus Baltobacteraceae bacterium]
MKICVIVFSALLMCSVAAPSFGQALGGPAAAAPSKDTINPTVKSPKADEGTNTNPKKSKKKTASSEKSAPSKDTAKSTAKNAPQQDIGTGANPSKKSTP